MSPSTNCTAIRVSHRELQWAVSMELIRWRAAQAETVVADRAIWSSHLNLSIGYMYTLSERLSVAGRAL